MDYNYNNLRLKIKSEKGKKLIQRVKKFYAENYENTPLISLTYSKFKMICTTGNRSEYEAELNQRTARWSNLIILALDEDKYIIELEDVLAAICDEFSWTLPAHSVIDREKGAFDYSFIDLHAAHMAFFLSETMEVFGEKLSSDICERIRYCIKTKIIDNFENGKFWWEDVKGSNWAAVCAGGIGIAYIYTFPERFPLVEGRIFAALETYTEGLREDGFCEEGVDYCVYGLGFLLDFVDIFLQKYGYMPEFMQTAKKKILALLDYYMNGILDGRYLPFGDVSTEEVTDYPVQDLVFKKLFPDNFKPADYDYCDKAPLDLSVLSAVRLVDGIDRFKESERRCNEASFTKFYKSEGMFLYQNASYAFAAKGGDNGILHNHNDAGSFILSVKGKRIVADPGAGKYTLDYFNPDKRYGDKIFVCGSQAHSVPIVGGAYQKYGKQYAAKVLNVSEKSVSFDISQAYGLKKNTLKVTYECREKDLSVDYEFVSEKKTNVTFRFVSDFEPYFKDGRLFIEETEIVYDKICSISIGKREYEPKTITKAKTAYLLDFTLKDCDRIGLNFCFKTCG